MKPVKESFAFIVRPATSDDREARRLVSLATWKHAYAHIFTLDLIERVFAGQVAFHAAWETQRRQHLPGFVAVSSDNSVIGHLGTALWESPEGVPPVGEVTVLYLLPEWHGLGVGHALWNAARADLQTRGCRTLWVYVLAKAAAVQFYERQGGVHTVDDVIVLDEQREAVRGYRVDLTSSAL
ncbi:MAG: GNAT family N-acetyltransferase [Chloroflexota bacterium]|nr:GNAT family N-acetyltransferase [Chloroflexota bacterium]